MNNKVVIISQARMGSTRLPGKVLKKIGEKTMLEIHLDRAKASKLADQIILATTTEKKDDVLVEFASNLNLTVYRGSEIDVLDRYYQAALLANAEIVVRITSDCPLIDAEIIDYAIQEHITNNKDFTSNIIKRSYPDGMDVEVFSFKALENAWKNAISKDDREHVTYYIWKNADLCGGNLFTAHNFEFQKDYSQFRLTLDYETDYNLFSTLILKLGYQLKWIDYAIFLDENPEISSINSQ